MILKYTRRDYKGYTSYNIVGYTSCCLKVAGDSLTTLAEGLYFQESHEPRICIVCPFCYPSGCSHDHIPIDFCPFCGEKLTLVEVTE